MSLLNWFKALASGKEVDEDAAEASVPAASPPDDDSESSKIAGLNFKDAIDVHIAWKARLEKCIAGDNEEGLKVDVVSRDDRCELGKWIYGVGNEKYGHLREFQEMKMEHMRFHLAAGDVFACCIAGDKDGAAEKLRTGEYPRASYWLKLHLSRLYLQLTDQSTGK